MKKYNILSNLLYVFKLEIKSDKKYKWFFIFYVLIMIFLPVLLGLIPSFVVSAIKINANFYGFVLILLMMLLIYISLNCFNTYLEEIISFKQTVIRSKDSFISLANKSLTMDYFNFEPYPCRIRSKKAYEALSSNWVGVEGMMKRIPQVLISLLGIILYGILFIKVSYVITLILFVATIIAIILSYLSAKFYQKEEKINLIYYNKQDQLAKISKDEAYSKDLRIYHYKPFFTSYAASLLNKLRKSMLKLSFFDNVPTFANTILALIRDLLCYILLVKGIYDGVYNVVEFTFYMSIMLGLSNWLNSLAYNISALYFNSIDVTNYRLFLDYPNQLCHEDGLLTDDLLNKQLEIEFKNVSFCYPGSEKPAICNVSFKLKAGEKLALVGANGAGKTTIVKLICGLYRPTEGEILINGIKATNFNIFAYYKLFGAVFQDDVAFDFTICENVGMQSLENINRDKVRECLKQAGLWEMVDNLAQKEETYLGKTYSADGIKLSGGQMQKLILARALYKNAPILLLDEPTAALDPLAEANLYLKYDELTKGKTSLFISHRLSSTKFCNRIIVLENGQIIEEGIHQDLIAKKGKYYEMFEAQAKYYKDGDLNEKN